MTDVSTAAGKLMNTLRVISHPGEDAAELELALSTVAMGLERAIGQQLAETQASGDLDEFVLNLARFIAVHRSDTANRLVVVELPRGIGPLHRVPDGTRLRALDDAELAMADADEVPW